MAKFKVHMAGSGVVGESGVAVDMTPLCRTKARTLLPLRFSHEWSAVTCDRCLRHRPRPTLRQRLVAFYTLMFGGR